LVTRNKRGEKKKKNCMFLLRSHISAGRKRGKKRKRKGEMRMGRKKEKRIDVVIKTLATMHRGERGGNARDP